MAGTRSLADLMARVVERLGRELTEKEVARLDKKAIQELANKKTTVERAANLLGKSKLTADEAVGFGARRTPTPNQVRVKNKATGEAVKPKARGGQQKPEQALAKDVDRLSSMFKKLEDGQVSMEEFNTAVEQVAKQRKLEADDVMDQVNTRMSEGRVTGQRISSKGADVTKYREDLLNAGYDKNTVDQIVFTEEKFAAKNEGGQVAERVGSREQYRPADTRTVYASVTVGKKKLTGAGRNSGEATQNLTELMKAEAAKETKQSSSAAIKSSAEPKTSPIKQERGLSVVEKTNEEAPVETVRGTEVHTPQTTALTERGEQRLAKDAEFTEVPSRRGTGKQVATGVAVATGLGIAASEAERRRKARHGTSDPEESQKKWEATVGRFSDSTEAATATAAQLEETGGADVGKSQEEIDRSGSFVDTKGGRYQIYKKGSKTANSWRAAYAAAREAGEAVFTFNGLKYKV